MRVTGSPKCIDHLVDAIEETTKLSVDGCQVWLTFRHNGLQVSATLDSRSFDQIVPWTCVDQERLLLETIQIAASEVKRQSG